VTITDIGDALSDRCDVPDQLFSAVMIRRDSGTEKFERQQRCAAVLELGFHVLWSQGKVRGGHEA
jgi:hypothetical protein